MSQLAKWILLKGDASLIYYITLAVPKKAVAQQKEANPIAKRPL
jgi:hypothetical protein